MSRRLFLLLFALSPLLAHAHVNSPNVIFEGRAGLYPVRVVIRPPGVVPGLAEISVRVHTNGARLVSVLPVHWRAGIEGSPPPDVARPVAGEAGLYHAELWFMARGAYSVHVKVEGEHGAGTVMVPVNSLAVTRLSMPNVLGGILLAVGIFLFLAAVSIVGAAVRESVLEPGVAPTLKRRWFGRAAVAGSALVLSVSLYAGRGWWNSVDRDYRNNKMFKPVRVQAAVRDASGQRLLQLSILETNSGGFSSSPLVPDHGKLMHLFLVRAPGMDAFAHLHPVRRDARTFDAALPPLPAGDYDLYADVTHESGFSQTLTATVNVPETVASTNSVGLPLPPDESDSWRLGPARETPVSANKPVCQLNEQLAMIWDRPEKLIAGRDLTLRFAVLDADGHPAPLEPYLGMSSHAALRRDDGRVFTHLHPSGSISMAAQQVFQLRAEGAPSRRITAEMMDKLCQAPTPQQMREAIAFPYEFPDPGAYRIWVQVKSAGKILTGVFDAVVAAK